MRVIVAVLFAILIATTLFCNVASEANTLCPQCIRRHKQFLKAWSDNGFFEEASDSKPFDKKEFEKFENDLDNELTLPTKNTLAYEEEAETLAVEDDFLDDLLGDDAKEETADQYEELERMEGIKRRLENSELDEKRFSQKSKGHKTLTKPTFETFKKLFFNFGAAA